MNGDGKCMADTVNPKWLSVLMEMQKTVSETASKVDALHSELLGDRGHIARLDRHVANLYDRDDKLRSEVTQRTAELERQIGKTANTDRSFRDRLSGGWSFILAILLVLSFVADLYMRVKGH
jgi:hypothetical protein